MAAGTQYRERMLVKSRSCIHVFDVRSLLWLQAAGKMVRLHTHDDTFTVGTTLQKLEAQLDPASFLRVDDRALVNVAHVTSIHRLTARRHILTLSNGDEVPLSSGYIRRVLSFFDLGGADARRR